MSRLSKRELDDDVVDELMANESLEYNTQQKALTESINRYSQGITSRQVTINKLQRLTSSYSNIKDKIDEIRQNKELVNAMVDE